jgi:outer membrane biogenesis lipoprotein LolB
MTRLRLTALCVAILTLAACSQTATDPAKTTADKPGTAQTQPPVSYTPSERSGGGGDGGGGGGGGGGY